MKLTCKVGMQLLIGTSRFNNKLDYVTDQAYNGCMSSAGRAQSVSVSKPICSVGSEEY